MLDVVLAKDTDDIAKFQQSQVDIDALLEANALGLCFALALGAGQVDQVELAFDQVVAVVRVELLEGDGEDGMGAGGLFVHGRASCHAVGGALLQHMDCFVGVAHLGLAEAYNSD